MNKLIAVLVSFVVVSSIMEWQLNPFKDYQSTKARIGRKIYLLYVADTDQKRIKGLSGASLLKKSEGMLFIADRPDYQSFWMKDMRFPLDLVFIKNGHVVEIQHGIQPESYPKIFTSQSPVDTVIELNAGQVDEADIDVGEAVRVWQESSLQPTP